MQTFRPKNLHGSDLLLYYHDRCNRIPAPTDSSSLSSVEDTPDQRMHHIIIQLPFSDSVMDDTNAPHLVNR